MDVYVIAPLGEHMLWVLLSLCQSGLHRSLPLPYLFSLWKTLYLSDDCIGSGSVLESGPLHGQDQGLLHG